MWISDAPSGLVTGSQFLFVTSFLLQVLFLIFLYGRLTVFKQNLVTPGVIPPVSVIVATRNEEENLRVLIPLLLNQSHPDFEIIIVNNQSTDQGKQVVEAFQALHTNIRLIELTDYSPTLAGKKHPLSVGIKAAKYDHFLFTDADCRPASTYWLQGMASSFSKSHEMVLGYGPYLKEKGFLNRCIRFDTAWIGITYCAYALAGRPYMGVGRNIAYTRKLYDSVNGFDAHRHIASGDDDLFIQSAAKKTKVCIQLQPSTFCQSKAEITLIDWMRQKARHYSTAGSYKVFKKALLGIYPVSMVLLYLSFVILLLMDEKWIFSSVAMVFIILIKWWAQGKALVKLDEKGFARFFPFLDLMYAIFIPMVYITQIRKPKNKW